MRVPTWLVRAALALAALVVVAALVFAAWRMLGQVSLERVEPARLRVGQRALLKGRGFAANPADNVVLFDGRRARVLGLTPAGLEVEVPEVVAEAGGERRVELRVERGRRSSQVIVVPVIQGPRVHALSPEVAMPGEEVTIVGVGLGLGAMVRFGSAPARVLEADGTHVRAVVPDLGAAPGTSAAAVVTVGGVDSNPAPFVLGRLPLVTGVAPASARPGDVVEISGRGFQKDPLQDDVRIGGVPALVVSVRDGALKAVVPRVGPGEAARAVEVRVPGNANVGTATLEVPAPPDLIEPRFVAEPFTAVAGRPHAVVATGLGPAFVLAASGARSAAERALEAAARLNGSIAALQATLGLTLEARGLGASPTTLGLTAQPEALLEVTDEDAAAYREDWSGLRGRGGAVTRERLARWWEAVGRDLVLLLVRGERPRFAAQLAPEGRALVQLHDAARKAGRPGVPRALLEQARPPLRDGLKLIALRVPASVPATVAPAGTQTATRAPVPRAFEGTLRGSELESGERRYLTVTLAQSGGTISYEGGLTLTMPLVSVEQDPERVRFDVNIRGGLRHYVGAWDGDRLVGSISTDDASREVVATFELRR